jgi:hypothetical protein
MSKQEFIAYLVGTLIPDLKESGSDATANDFAAAVLFMQGAKEVAFDYERDTVERIE